MPSPWPTTSPQTARVITAAAIMVTVFASFLFNPDATVKLVGLGLATAIVMDATDVRTILVPATMELLGDRNWWNPSWLDRLIPRVSVPGDELTADSAVVASASR